MKVEKYLLFIYLRLWGNPAVTLGLESSYWPLFSIIFSAPQQSRMLHPCFSVLKILEIADGSAS